MKILRPFLLGVAITGAFFYFTTWRHNGSSLLHTVSQPTRLEITEASAPETPDEEEQNNIGVYKKALPSVVNITSRAMAFDFFYGAVPQEGQGSGFVIDKEGRILTNFHVIADAQEIWATLSNKKKYRATVVGTDRAHDLAIIQIKAPELQAATLGDSRRLQVGQTVYAIGNPFGLSGTLTKGLVSSVRQIREPDGSTIDDAIQTDAAINPGNSGGPLLNRQGEVIGINTMIVGQQSAGLGFAIPINTAKAVLDDLVTLGRVRRPALGVSTLPIGPELADQLGLAADYGLLIVQVVPGSAADRAGLRGGTERAYISNYPVMVGGDLLVAVDGERIESQQDLAQIMNKHRAGDSVRMTLYRGKRRLEVTVAFGELRERA